MAYANDKGKAGDYDVRDCLNGAIGEAYGFHFERIGGTERSRKVFAGDVCLVAKDCKSPPEECVLYPYFIESKKHAHPRVFEDAEKARDDARWHNKKGYILFTQKQAQGEKVRDNKLVCMDWSTFADLLIEIQGYRNDAKLQ
jgi:hypothetical protein